MKIGAAEFEAEGSPDSVKEQLMLFVELVGKHLDAKAFPVIPAAAAVPNGSKAVPAAPTGLTVVLSDDPQPITDEVLARVFRRDEDAVSLLALPKTEQPEGDALLVLLYAFQRLLSKPNVTAVTLMQAARQSGVTAGRADVALKSKSDLVMAAGVRRGRRYSLNNRGYVHAEGLIRKMIA